MSNSYGSAPSEPLSLPNLPSSVRGGSERQGPSYAPADVSQGTAAPSASAGGSFGGTAGLATPYAPNPRFRADLGASALRAQRRRSFSTGPEFGDSEGLPSSDGADPEASHTFVWGTNINIASISSRLRRFLTQYEEPGTSEPKYMALLRQMYDHNETLLNIDCMNIYAFDAQLYQQLVMYPAEVLVLLDKEAKQVICEIARQDDLDFTVETKPYNLRETKVIRDLNPTDILKLISVQGMVTRCSSIIPDLRVALYKCEKCGAEDYVMNDRGRVEEPSACPACRQKFSERLIHNRSAFFDKQIIKLQENPNAIPEGETPHSLTMLVFEALVDTAKPGDRVTVTGIYKAIPMRVNPRNTALRSVYKAHIDVLHIQRDEGSRLFSLNAPVDEDLTQQPATPSEDSPINWAGDMPREQQQQREDELRAMAEEPGIYEKLAASIAPSIWQLDDVKKGILCQLFGGGCKEFSGGRVRGEINVLLVGDPGVSKSQLLGYVHQLAPRGIYTSGRGSSAVGLTAYVTKDPETREMVLESGALVLSDKGICCIDEFDKMSEAARSMLHEVMEQQTVSVAKAGIIATLNARTSVLASANPVGSRYNPRLSIIDNIHLPPSLISRFDLIYLILDKPNEATDRRLARHLISLYYERQPPSLQVNSSKPRSRGIDRKLVTYSQQLDLKKAIGKWKQMRKAMQMPARIPMAKLRDYIAFARARCHPELSDAAAEDLINGYLSLRRIGSSRKVITATPRQLESLVRLSEALARMRLSPTVATEDVAEAIRLMKVAIQQSATDPITGAIDMDMIQTGVSASARIALQQLAQEVQALLIKTPAGLTIEQLTIQVNAQSSLPVDAQQIKDCLRNIADDVITTGALIRHKNAA